MALTGALFAGVSGINANGNAMNIIGDNIANVNTVGFKSSRAVFFDLLSADVGGTKVGLGSRMADAHRPFVQGGVETTNSVTDMAIQGRGLFVLRDTAGASYYTRAGQFTLDDGGNLVNPAGLRVQGYGLDSAGNISTGLTDIVINQTVVSPTVTSTITLTANLDATSTTPATATPSTVNAGSGLISDAPGTWFASANFSSVQTVYDSLGQGHDLTYLFRKTGANTWSYNIVANGGEITGGTAGNLERIGTGTLAFNPDGSFNAAGSTIGAISIPATGAGSWSNGAAAQAISAANQAFSGTTQYAQASSVNVLEQNGSQSGVLRGITIGADGVITGQFTTGGTQPLFRVALADFASPEGLTHSGNSLFLESPESGPVLIGAPTNGSFGSVLSGSLELSTVDLATEFVKMVTTQRAFQASSRTITVTDTLLEEVSNLKR
jgi:flagellar hook protein FlgE